MPLFKNLLSDSISSFSDKDFIAFNSFPNNTPEVANLFADALEKYAINITPPSLTILQAKAAFIVSMNSLEQPYSQREFQKPFTVGFIAHEAKFNLFINYIKNKSGYKSDPKLDTLANQAILNKIRIGYNQLYPNFALTEDIIKYCQGLANELYYKKLLSSKNQRLLQVDGIIGDETIDISFTDSYNIAPKISLDADSRNAHVIQFKKDYNKKVFIQPIVWGNLIVDYYEDGRIKSTLTAAEFYNKWVKIGLYEDSTIIPIDKTQSDSPNIDYSLLISPNISYSKPFLFYLNEYERRHKLYDPIWKLSNINSAIELSIFSNLKKSIYTKKPSINKDGLSLLAKSINIFATQLALGMNPTFTGVPPTVPLILDPVKLKGLSGGISSDCVRILVDLINSWFISGTAINNQSGATITWV